MARRKPRYGKNEHSNRVSARCVCVDYRFFKYKKQNWLWLFLKDGCDNEEIQVPQTKFSNRG